ncbi:hypothetical protein CCHL11_08929 [Colletotrichum chlorophyti]|uniref:Uncharacterized protein n=1 Tax=Colletotrichum chlorophyti TaxID=708187 RepID=A0A1Q8RC75_9PEZI|nr:hypothetical protein CCHL11_08929 [Colletotrichum chlorophyti]
MAVEAALSASLEAQHQEEYIDYSEDEVADPAITAQGSNKGSFSANAQFLPEVSDNTDLLDPAAEYQTSDTRMTADTKHAVAAAEAEQGSDILDPVVADDVDSVVSNEQKAREEGVSFNENEINWEDGPGDGQAATQDDSHHEPEKDDWQLVQEGLPSAADVYNELDDREEVGSPEVDLAPTDTSNFLEHIDVNPEAAVAIIDAALEEQQAMDMQDPEADNDNAHEINYYEDGEVPTETSTGVGGNLPESYHLDHDRLNAEVEDKVQKTGGEDPNYQDAVARKPESQETEGQEAEDEEVENQDPEGQEVGDHAMREDGSRSQHEAESNSVVDDGDGDAQSHDEADDDAQKESEPQGELSILEQMEYDDDVLGHTRSSVSIDTPSPEDLDIPDITVSYKGVDYPFFYNSPDSEGKECFFSDLSLLHCKMEGVLAGFRRELANELGPFDELVFQIDELGLEFAESSQPELYSDITLGQIISVFDSLVKNQDPDASKPLYAFLLTRPNCKKRWLSLVDDAYNGKGIDEVGYYFQSQAHSEVPDMLDDDEPGLIGEDDNADATAWPNSPPIESEPDNENDENDEPSQVDMNESSETDNNITEDAAHLENAAGEDAFQTELTSMEDMDAETATVDAEVPLMDEPITVADGQAAEGDGMDSNDMSGVMEDQPEHVEENVTDTDPSNPLANWDTEGSDALNSVGADQLAPEDDLHQKTVDQAIQDANENSANKVTPNTSATSTLNGDEEPTYEDELDLNADLPAHEHDSVEATGQDDELEEIDWREFPGQGDDDLVQSPTTMGKRPRSDVDDLLDDEAEKDVKRRRS